MKKVPFIGFENWLFFITFKMLVQKFILVSTDSLVHAGMYDPDCVMIG